MVKPVIVSPPASRKPPSFEKVAPVAVKFCPLRSKVPLVMVNALVTVKAFVLKSQAPPTPLKVIP